METSRRPGPAGDPPGHASELERLRDQLAKIAESVPGVICSYRLRADGSACFPFATAAGEDVWGISPSVVAEDAAPVFDRLHPDDAHRVGERIAEAARAGARWHDRFRYQHPAKGLRWLEGWSVPKTEPDGSVLWHGFVMDVTDQVAAEQALRDSDRRKSEFLAVLSHELRNPLAPIRDGLYLLDRMPPGSPQAARAREVIHRQTDHLARLVDDLLDVTRISRGKMQLRRERLELRELVRRTCDDHRPAFEQRGIELRIALPAGAVWVDADATRLAQVLGNLLQNAAKFTGEGGHVGVSASTGPGEVQLRVADDGIGLAPELVPRLFEPFVQAENGQARTHGGLGLGLALVKGLVELHGGSVRAQSAGRDRGATFTVTLPQASAPAPRASPPAARPAAARTLTVLVIEDNLDAARTVADLLELDGHRVVIATDGRSGIARAREAKPDFVLCDVGLPDVDGYEVARTLRADPALASTRLVALSGYAQPEDKERARAAGFDAHLAKPAPFDELHALLAGAP
ncbi:hybrid sensor histidine kinase/response regulator [Anaeromyxobacter diazotrophicus]|uniref:histidine kinase n=1 Tax=Anaeromyxobacter diazotrophicus TaxID=2590199 RepID=A0A7I9VIN4_9BACT|nr:ATP-binding protein [Anaeromyxobacter diazotrophicus]GEJ55998.1 hypothetical protein AMYX_07390 [Anaeromyxobacter diazotrophicus]